MKKRAMKKYIPENCRYCYGCKWRKFLGNRIPKREWCGRKETCKKETCDCQIEVWRCDYVGYTDITQGTLLWDECKICPEKGRAAESEDVYAPFWDRHPRMVFFERMHRRHMDKMYGNRGQKK